MYEISRVVQFAVRRLLHNSSSDGLNVVVYMIGLLMCSGRAVICLFSSHDCT
jgi:hypothetical protein